ncbi:MAG: response regulator [Candidatus Manganitrophus sp.]|nr:MAG: response regulator [Candidatus Manganitrophus sp.]
MERHFILIVDDEPSIRSSLARLLQREGYDTLLAESAEDGLAILEKKSFSAVISDYRMPGRSGTDFLTDVKKAASGVDPDSFEPGKRKLTK